MLIDSLRIGLSGLLLALLALVPAHQVMAEDETRVRYDGHAIVRAEVRTNRDLMTMLQLSPDCWAESHGLGMVEFRIPPDRMGALKASGIKFEVLIPDVQVLIDAELRRISQSQQNQGGIAGGFDPGFFLEYQRVDEINEYLAQLEAAYPDRISIQQYASSLLGRPIMAATIGEPGEGKPAICINGMAHSREWISPATVMLLVDRLVRNPDGDSLIDRMVEEVTWYILPVINPDGYEHAWDVDRLWRKTRRNNGDGTFGVDWNRNFDAEFGGPGSSSNTSSDIYHGPFPFSEPESQALRDFILEHDDIVVHLDIHSFSQLVLWPYGYTFDTPEDPKRWVLENIGTDMAGAIFQQSGRVYTPQPAAALYLASGTSLDWAFDGAGILSWTYELRDTGEFGFLLPPDQIIPTGQEFVAAMALLWQRVVDGIQVDYIEQPTEVIVAGQPSDLSLRIAPVAAGALVESSATLWTRINGGRWESSPLSFLGVDLYEGQIQAQSCGVLVEYYISINSDDGITFTDPPLGHRNPYEATVIELVEVFVDDFENDLDWIVINGSGLTDGQWDRNEPMGLGDRGDPPTAYGGSGQCYLTNSADGNTDVDGGCTELVSPIMDATDPDVVLEYARWYDNSTGASPQSDIFVVEVSDDGGNTWVQLEVVGPAGAEVQGGWYYKSFPISGIDGIEPSESFRVKFIACDEGAGSVVEAAVDSVLLAVTGCSNGADLNGDGFIDGQDLALILGNWGACDDCLEGCPEDLTGDCVVDGADLAAILGSWLPAP